jgi:hypothetical protein
MYLRMEVGPLWPWHNKILCGPYGRSDSHVRCEEFMTEADFGATRDSPSAVPT